MYNIYKIIIFLIIKRFVSFIYYIEVLITEDNIINITTVIKINFFTIYFFNYLLYYSYTKIWTFRFNPKFIMR